MWNEPVLNPELHLPAPLTLRLFDGDGVIFSSERHWLHPLFDLEAFFAQGGQDPTRTRLVDRITGRAAAFLVARLGIPELHTLILSRRAIPILALVVLLHQTLILLPLLLRAGLQPTLASLELRVPGLLLQILGGFALLWFMGRHLPSQRPTRVG